VQQSAKLYRNK